MPVSLSLLFLFTVSDCFREERSRRAAASFLLPMDSTTSPILGFWEREGALPGRDGGKKGISGVHFFLPGQRLFHVLGLMGQGASHCSEGQDWVPSAGKKTTSMGTQNSS